MRRGGRGGGGRDGQTRDVHEESDIQQINCGCDFLYSHGRIQRC